MKRVIYFVLFPFLLLACKDSKTSDLIHIDGYDDKVVAEIQIDDCTAIALESSKDCMLNAIQKIKFLENLIIIQSENGVFSFDNQTGRFICSYGERGNGVGEYNRINTFYIDKANRSIQIVDGVRNQIISYNINGEYLSHIKFPVSVLSLCSHVDLLNRNELYASNFIYNDKNNLYSTIDLQKKDFDVFMQIPVQSNNTQEPFGQHSFYIKNDTLKALIPYSNIVYVYENKSLIPWLHVDTQKDIITPDAQKEIKNFGIFSYFNFLNQNKFVGFTDIFETSTRIVLGFYNLQYFVVDKESWQGFLYENKQGKGELLSMPFVDIKATYEDYYVGAVDAHRLKEWKISPKSTDEGLKSLLQIQDSISENANPVILFYKLK